MRLTEHEYQQYLAKREREGKVDDTGPERELHASILKYCVMRGWIAFHGSIGHKTRRTVGEPDFVILAGNGTVLMIECKTKTGKLTLDQAATIAWAEKLGHTIYVVRSMREFVGVIKDKGME